MVNKEILLRHERAKELARKHPSGGPEAKAKLDAQSERLVKFNDVLKTELVYLTAFLEKHAPVR